MGRRRLGLTLVTASAACLLIPASGAFSAEGKVVAQVEFRGLVTYDPATLGRAIATRAGSPYNPAVASQDILRLEHFRVFERITVATEETAAGLKVVFLVAERPVIRSVRVIGCREMPAGKILEKITRTLVGGRYDPAQAAFDAHDALDMMRENAYYDAKITPAAVLMEGPGIGRPAGVQVIFTVEEGEAVRIKEVRFEGNTAFADKELLRLVKVRPKRWYNAGALKDWQLEWDAASLRAAFRAKGYLDVKIEASRSGRSRDEGGRTWIDIIFGIKEGPQYKVGAVTVTGNKLASTERILSETKLKPGEIFSDEQRLADTQAIFSIYGDMGRIFTSVMINTALAEAAATIDLLVRIREGEVVTVREIEPLGNTKTKDIVILREMRLYPGEAFDWSKYRESIYRLRRLDYFSKLAPHIQPTEDPTQADVIIEVEEKLTGMFQLGAAVSSNEDYMFNIELSQRNFDAWDWPKSWGDFWSGNAFVGDGQKLSLVAALGDVTKSLSMTWVEPWLFNRPVRLGVKVYDQVRSYSDYDDERTGGRLSIGKRWESDWSIGISGNIRNVRIDDIDSGVDAASPIRDEEGLSRINSMGLSIGYEGRDSFMFPTRGVRVRLSEELAGGPFGGDKDFLRSSALISGHIPLGPRRKGQTKPPILSLRLSGDWIVPYGDSDEVPVYERLFAGGIGTIRGFDYRSVSPRFPDEYGDEVGGRFKMLETAELSFPFLGQNGEVRGSVFYDRGFVWADPNDYEWGDQKKSWGFGVIFLIPGQGVFLPFKIYWGFPIDRESTDDVERVSFTFGSYF